MLQKDVSNPWERYQVIFKIKQTGLRHTLHTKDDKEGQEDKKAESQNKEQSTPISHNFERVFQALGQMVSQKIFGRSKYTRFNG